MGIIVGVIFGILALLMALCILMANANSGKSRDNRRAGWGS